MGRTGVLHSSAYAKRITGGKLCHPNHSTENCRSGEQIQVTDLMVPRSILQRSRRRSSFLSDNHFALSARNSNKRKLAITLDRCCFANLFALLLRVVVLISSLHKATSKTWFYKLPAAMFQIKSKKSNFI